MVKSTAFLDDLQNRMEHLPQMQISDLKANAGGIDRIYLVFVDILKGFCEQGPLASDRVQEMVEPVRQLTEHLREEGIPDKNLIFLHDAHPEDAVEFETFAPHCVRNTPEAEIVDALKPYWQLPGTQTFQKNSINGLFGVNQEGIPFHEWLREVMHKEKSLFLVVGDCTDLCIYQNAMGIRLLANEMNTETEVVVSQQHVRTFHISVEQAQSVDIPAHDADWLDPIFLYHMQSNGIQVVSDVVNK